MKHLLNNLTEEEKNSIRGQHTDKFTVVTENFSKLINTKGGEVKTYLKEDVDSEKPKLSQPTKKVTLVLDCDKKTIDGTKLSSEQMSKWCGAKGSDILDKAVDYSK